MKVIVVANQKGGVGKTSSAVEIAACLVYEGKKVLFIDLDQQVNSTTYLGLPKVQTVPTSYEVLCGDAPIIESIQRRNFKGVGDIDVIPASEKLSTIEKLFPEAEDVFMLADRIDELDENENINYDYVIIDTNPARDQLLKMSYATSDYAIIPTMSDRGSLDGIVNIYSDIKKFRDGRLPFTQIQVLGLILTRYERSLSYVNAFEDLVSIANAMSEKPFVDKVRKSIAMSDCKDIGVPLLSFDKYNNASLDYKRIAQEIIKRTEGED